MSIRPKHVTMEQWRALMRLKHKLQESGERWEVDSTGLALVKVDDKEKKVVGREERPKA